MYLESVKKSGPLEKCRNWSKANIDVVSGKVAHPVRLVVRWMSRWAHPPWPTTTRRRLRPKDHRRFQLSRAVALIAIWRSVSEVFDVSAESGRAMGTGNGLLRGARDA